jgi:RND family efflux transporter MFP subunit
MTLAENVVPGSFVEAGQPLGTLAESLSGADRADVLIAAAEAEVLLARARKELELAERDAERADQLESVLSERERVLRWEDLRVARAAVEPAERVAGRIGAVTSLRAQVSGRIAGLLARPGQVVAEGELLFSIVGVGPAWVEAHLPGAAAGAIEAGANARVVPEGHPDVALDGVVLDPGRQADDATGMLRLTLAVNEAPEWLVPGMPVSGFLSVGSPRDVLVVPDDAVVESSGETLVFVKTAPEAFEARSIRLGAQADGMHEVLAGLSAGERLVVAGTYTLRSLAGR